MRMHTTTSGRLKVSVALDPEAYEQLRRLAGSPHRMGALLDGLILAETQRCETPAPAPLVATEEAIRREYDQVLQKVEQQAADLIRYAPTGIYEVDFRTGRFRSVNDAMCGILGYSRQELMQMTAFDLLDDAGKVLFAERIRRTLAGEKVDTSVEYCVVPKRGGPIYSVLNVRILHEEGCPVGAFVIAHDVTERRRLIDELRTHGEQLERLAAEQEAILAAIAEGLIVTGRDGRILRQNATANEMLGYDEEAQNARIEERWAKVLPFKPDGTLYRPAELPGARALRGETVSDEEMILPISARSGGLQVAVSSAPIRDRAGNVTGCVTTFRDVSASHAVADQLSRTAARLQQANDALQAQAKKSSAVTARLEQQVRELTAELAAEVAEHKQVEVQLRESLRHGRELSDHIAAMQEAERRASANPREPEQAV
jgi:PAS domain S-box-containing protein